MTNYDNDSNKVSKLDLKKDLHFSLYFIFEKKMKIVSPCGVKLPYIRELRKGFHNNQIF